MVVGGGQRGLKEWSEEERSVRWWEEGNVESGRVRGEIGVNDWGVAWG